MAPHAAASSRENPEVWLLASAAAGVEATSVCQLQFRLMSQRAIQPSLVALRYVDNETKLPQVRHLYVFFFIGAFRALMVGGEGAITWTAMANGIYVGLLTMTQSVASRSPWEQSHGMSLPWALRM